MRNVVHAGKQRHDHLRRNHGARPLDKGSLASDVRATRSVVVSSSRTKQRDSRSGTGLFS